MNFVLIGNKCDLVNERQVSKEEAQKFVQKHQITFFKFLLKMI